MPRRGNAVWPRTRILAYSLSADLYGVSACNGLSANGLFSVHIWMCFGRYRWLAMIAAAVEELTHLTADLLNEG